MNSAHSLYPPQNDLSLPPYTVDFLPDDPDAQVEQTVAKMRALAVEDAQSPEVQADIARALASCPTADPLQCVWDYVRGHMTFVQDRVPGAYVEAQRGDGLPVIEVLIHPRVMGDWQQGDCDDYSTYAASMLTGMGIDAAFVTVAADNALPDQYSHVYLAAYPVIEGNKVRVPMDLSHGGYLGWETGNLGRIREWPVGGIGGGALGLALLLGGAALVMKGRR